MSESIVDYSCIYLILRQTHGSSAALPLNQWLSHLSPQLECIPMEAQGNILRTVLILPDNSLYRELLEVMLLGISQYPLITYRDKNWEIVGVEAETGDLFEFSFSLRSNISLDHYMGRALHALFLQWIRASDPQLSLSIHEQENCPFTIDLILQHEGFYEINITLMQKDLLSPLLWGISQNLGREVNLSNIPCRLGRIIRWKKSTGFAALLDLAVQSSLKFNFLSPTSFKQRNMIQTFPLPDLVFGSLWRKWNGFTPSAFILSPVDWSAWVSAYDLKTRAIPVKKRAEIGCVGWISYGFKDIEQAKVATALAHFSNFSGVGRKTGMGMGRVEFKIENYDR